MQGAESRADAEDKTPRACWRGAERRERRRVEGRGSATVKSWARASGARALTRA